MEAQRTIAGREVQPVSQRSSVVAIRQGSSTRRPCAAVTEPARLRRAGFKGEEGQLTAV